MNSIYKIIELIHFKHLIGLIIQEIDTFICKKKIDRFYSN